MTAKGTKESLSVVISILGLFILGSFLTTAILLATFPYLSPRLSLLDLKLLDVWLRVTASPAMSSETDVFIVFQDTKSERELEAAGVQYRQHHPKLLRDLIESGRVRVVVFDQDFDLPGPVHDDLADVLRRYSAKIIVGANTAAAFKDIPLVRGYIVESVARNPDRVVRTVEVAKPVGAECIPTLALASVAAFFGLDVSRQLECAHDDIALRPSFSVPIDSQGLMIINFLGPAGTFPSVSYADVIGRGAAALQDLPQAGAKRDKIAIVGLKAANHRDDWLDTPFGRMTGVEVQANIVHTLLDPRRFIHPLSQERTSWLLAMLGILATLLGPIARRKQWWATVLATAAAGLIICSFVAFLGKVWNQPGVFFAMLVIAMMLAWIELRIAMYARRLLGRKRPMSTFSRFEHAHGIVRDFLVGAALSLLLGHGEPWVVFLVGGFVGAVAIGTLRRGTSRLALNVAVAVMTCSAWLVSAAEGQDPRPCGSIDRLLEYSEADASGAREYKRVDRTQLLALVRGGQQTQQTYRGQELRNGDQLTWGRDVSFVLQYRTGTVQTYGPSKIRATLTIQCEDGSIVGRIREMIGQIRSFVKEGSTLRIPIDDMVTAGTRGTGFELDVDSGSMQVVVTVWQGAVDVRRADGMSVVVENLWQRNVAYSGPLKSGRKMTVLELDGLRWTLLADAGVFDIKKQRRCGEGDKVTAIDICGETGFAPAG